MNFITVAALAIVMVLAQGEHIYKTIENIR